MSDAPVQLLRGTLDVMVLKAVSWGPLHGYAITRWIAETTDEAFLVQEGALYPALRRLEQKGRLRSSWSVTETGREAKYYELTDSGRAQLRTEVRMWTRYVEAMSRVLQAISPAGGGV